MAVFSFGNAFIDILALVSVLIIGIFLYAKWSFGYWKRRGVVTIKPRFPYGSLGNPATDQQFIALRNEYHILKSQGHKHAGCYMFTTPFYVPMDPDLVKSIMQKDFQHFVNRGLYFNEKTDPLSAHLFNIEGQKWKNLRHTLTPTFTSGKMKMMFQTLVECSKQMTSAIEQCCEKKEVVGIKDMLSNFTMDVIGSCAFGIDCNSFNNPNSEFVKQGKRNFIQTKRDKFNDILSTAFPDFCRKLGLTVTPKESTRFYLDIVGQTVKYREENGVVRKDFMQILIDLKNNTKASSETEMEGVAKNLSIEEIAAQVFVFFLAGFETSSTTMTFALFELAQNADVQQKLRDEINTVLEKHNGNLTYEAVQQMKYMDQVVEESLRKYPPLPVLLRKCNEKYNVPGTDVVIEEGVSILIPIFGIHRDPEYYPEPEKFDPERFNEENKKQRHPFTYLPFGEGPRICIGLRFGIMQSKVGLAALLKNYSFTVNKKTQLPLKMDPYSFVLTAIGGIWLDVKAV